MQQLHTSTIRYLCRAADGIGWVKKTFKFTLAENTPEDKQAGKSWAIDEGIIRVIRQWQVGA